MSFENTSTAVKELLYANGIDENMLKEAFALFSGFDIDYADFYFQRTVAESYVLEEIGRASCRERVSWFV